MDSEIYDATGVNDDAPSMRPKMTEPTTGKCADGREHLYLCVACGKHGPEDADVERLTKDAQEDHWCEWRLIAEGQDVNMVRLIDDLERVTKERDDLELARENWQASAERHIAERDKHFLGEKP